MPVDAVVYTTLLTLAVFLIFRIPAIWRIVDFNKGNQESNRPAAGAAAILYGLLMLTIHLTMGSTHTWGGVNFADAFNSTMSSVGIGCLIFGIGLLVWKPEMKRTLSSKKNISIPGH